MAVLRAALIFFSIEWAFLACLACPVNGESEVYNVGVPIGPGICEIQPDGEYRGFAVDVWKEIAIRSAIKYKLEACATMSACRTKFYSGSLDIVLLGMYHSRDSSKHIVFSRPYFISGLRILAVDMQHYRLFTDIEAMSALFSPIVMQSALVFMLFVFIFGNILWFMERRDVASISHRYGQGIFDAMWCVLSIKTTIGFGDVVPKNSHARILSVLIWLIGLLLLNLITAEVISEFAANKVKSTIVGLEDLKGKKIAAVDDNLTLAELKKIGAEIVVKPTLPLAYEEMKNKKADAVALYFGVDAAYAKMAADDGLSVKIIPGRHDNIFITIAMNKKLLLNDPALLDKINCAIDDMYDNSYISFLESKWLDSPGN
ncbi:MAG: transporter substrate-binding domain-containing protein [Nitrospirae bacterium]|nr:transporter substrate-binding domain-containing protein [Nitrospirota bacterium]